MYQVQKKDGQVQDFDRTKIISGVVNAGATPEEAERVAIEVENWLPTVAAEGSVNVTDLRIKVLEVLGMVNPTVAGVFGAYQKPALVEPEETETEEMAPETPVSEETPEETSEPEPGTNLG